MTQTLDPEISPQWFIDIFLEVSDKLRKDPQRYLKARSSICHDDGYLKDGLVSLYTILTQDFQIIYIGRKYQPQKKENQIEYYKFTTPFEYETKENREAD